jgi:hypothetical protein
MQSAALNGESTREGGECTGSFPIHHPTSMPTTSYAGRPYRPYQYEERNNA